jgi:mannose-6-phosphate isomerase-like protein (cupin superfamily)
MILPANGHLTVLERVKETALREELMDPTRRALLQALPLLTATPAPAADGPVISSFIKPYDELPVKQNGPNQSRAILDGLTHTGYHIEVHETTLAPGSAPHPPHRHEHEEFFMLMKGTLVVTIADKTGQIGPGGAAFVHSNELHGVHNPGPEPAQYFVVAVGS